MPISHSKNKNKPMNLVNLTMADVPVSLAIHGSYSVWFLYGIFYQQKQVPAYTAPKSEEAKISL
jgi:hypothetical protein